MFNLLEEFIAILERAYQKKNPTGMVCDVHINGRWSVLNKNLNLRDDDDENDDQTKKISDR